MNLLRAAGLLLLVGASLGGRCGNEDDDDDLAGAYKLPRDLPGLGEHVTFVVTKPRPGHPGTQKFVLDSSGNRRPMQEVIAAERAARISKFGALSPELYGALDRMTDEDTVPIASFFQLDVDWDSLDAALQSRDPATRRGGQATLHDAIASQGARVADDMARASIPPLYASASVPMMTGRVGKAGLRAIAHIPGLVIVIPNPVSRGVLLGSGVAGDMPGIGTFPNGITDTNIDCIFNRNGFLGEGQRIGLMEEKYCGFWGAHDSMSNDPSLPIFEHAPDACAGDEASRPLISQHCTDTCGEGFGGSVVTPPGTLCMPSGPIPSGSGRVCVNEHSGFISSILSPSYAVYGPPVGPVVASGSSAATIVYPNNGDDLAGKGWSNPSSFLACDLDNTAHAFDWLTQFQQTYDVVQPYYCSLGVPDPVTFDPADGVVEEFVARHSQVAIFKSSNDKPGSPVGCHSLNSICVGGNNYLGRGIHVGLTEDSQLGNSASWMNPPGTDIEKPDVTALSTLVDVEDQQYGVTHGPTVHESDPHTWTQSDGTSFSAPIAASFSALFKQACGQNLPQRMIRSMFRTGSWRHNPDGSRYSNSHDADGKDGAGALTADSISLFCNDLSSPGDDETPTVFSLDIPLYFSAATTLPTNVVSDGRVGHPLFTFQLSSDWRFRATMSWDACGPTEKGANAIGIGTDFDLFLCPNPADGRPCLGISQTVDDNNEGFDVSVPPDSPFNETYTLYWAVPPGATACGGADHETVSLTLAYGTEAAFDGDNFCGTLP